MSIATFEPAHFLVPGLGAGFPVKVVAAGDGPTTLVNNDENNTVYLGGTSGVNPTRPNTGFLPPQASTAVDGDLDVYAICLAGQTADFLTLPGDVPWQNPVGVQIALSALGLATAAKQDVQTGAINNPGYGPPTHGDVATTLTGAVNNPGYGPSTHTDLVATLPTNLQTSGIPPINNHNQILTLGATALGIGGSNTSAAAAITQPAYEIYVTVFTTAGGLGGIGHVRLDWSDQATGLVVDQDSFWVYPGTGSGAASHVFKGRGPSKGNQVKVFTQCPGNSAAGITISYTMFQSSRLITTAFDADLWTTVQSPSLSSGPPLVSNDPISRIIGSQSLSVAANSQSTSQGLPLYNGPVVIKFATSSGANDAAFEITDSIDPNTNGADTTVYKAQSDATGRINVQWRLPRIQCFVVLSNNNAAAKTLSFQIIGA